MVFLLPWSSCCYHTRQPLHTHYILTSMALPVWILEQSKTICSEKGGNLKLFSRCTLIDSCICREPRCNSRGAALPRISWAFPTATSPLHFIRKSMPRIALVVRVPTTTISEYVCSPRDRSTVAVLDQQWSSIYTDQVMFFPMFQFRSQGDMFPFIFSHRCYCTPCVQ